MTSRKERSCDLDYLRSARQASSAVGDSRTWSSTNIVLSDLLIERGEMEKALNLSQEAIAFGQESGDRVAEAWAQMEAGQVLFAQGALEEAEAHLRRAAQQLLASLDLASVAKANARIAHCYLRQGRLEEAQTILAEEAARLRKSGARGYFTRDVRTGNAFACLLALEQATKAEKGGAFKDAKSACRDLLEHGRSDTPALVSAYRMQGTFEWLRGRPGKAEEWWRRSLEHAGRLGAHYEEALTRLEIGKRTGDRNTLETAETAFAQMGAQFDRTQARELLDGMSRV